jgi:hypothetical protein
LRPLRKILSEIHSECNSQNAKTKVEVHNDEIMVTTRSFGESNSYCSYVFISKLNLRSSSDEQDQRRRNQGSVEIRLPGLLDQVVFAGRLIQSVGEQADAAHLFITGPESHLLGWQGIEELCRVSREQDEGSNE